MKPNKRDIASKIIAIIAFTCIIISLVIIIVTPPATGYEISIYYVYPWYFWLLIITSIFLGQVFILIDIFYKSIDQNHRTWFIGIIAIIIPIIILLFMLYVRGYFTYGRGDHLTHIGIIKDIINTGHIQMDNFYPNMHILGATFTQICSCSVFDTANFIPRFFFFLAPISMYLFYAIILKNKNEMKLALVLASSIIFTSALATYLAPYYLSFLFTPLILYLYFKRLHSENSIVFSILFIILIIGFNFYHPLNSLQLIFVFLIIVIIAYLLPKITDEDTKNIIIKSSFKEKSINAVLMTSLLFFLWYFSFSQIIGDFEKVFSSIFLHTDVSFIQTQFNIINTFKPKIFDLIKLVIYKYGTFLIISFVSILLLIYILIEQYRKYRRIRLSFKFLFSGLIILLFGLISSGAILSNLIVNWQRFANWEYLFAFVLISPIIYSFICHNKLRNGIYKFYNKSFKIIILCILLVFILFLSTFTLYFSPTIRDVNHQVTSMELTGMEWILNGRNKQYLIDQMGIEQDRYSNAIYNLNTSDLQVQRNDIVPPDHFSYNNNTFLGIHYNQSRYLVISRLIKIFYPEVYPDYKNYWRFNSEDFNKLQNDKTVIKIYINGEFEIYFIRSSKI